MTLVGSAISRDSWLKRHGAGDWGKSGKPDALKLVPTTGAVPCPGEERATGPFLARSYYIDSSDGSISGASR